VRAINSGVRFPLVIDMRAGIATDMEDTALPKNICIDIVKNIINGMYIGLPLGGKNLRQKALMCSAVPLDIKTLPMEKISPMKNSWISAGNAGSNTS